MEREKFVGTQEVANFLRIARRSVQKMCAERKIPFYEVVKGKFTFRLSEVEKWVGGKKKGFYPGGITKGKEGDLK